MDNSREQMQQRSMAEHEKEMQRQMMSVPSMQASGGSGIVPAPPGVLLPPPPLPLLGNLNVGIGGGGGSGVNNSSSLNIGGGTNPMLGNMGPPNNLIQNEQLHHSQMIQQQQQQQQQHDQHQMQQQQQQQQLQSISELPSLMSVIVDKPDDLKSLKSSTVVILPKALEDVFAFKDQLADELGRKDGEIPAEMPDNINRKLVSSNQMMSTGVISTEYADADADSDDDESTAATSVQQQKHQSSGNQLKKYPNQMNNNNTASSVDIPSDGSIPTNNTEIPCIKSKVDKNKEKKKRKKQNRQQRQAQQKEYEEKRLNEYIDGLTIEEDDKLKNNKENKNESNDSVKNENGLINGDQVTIEYVPDKITIADLAPMYRQFYRVFEIFKLEDKQVLPKDSNSLNDESNSFSYKHLKDKLIEDDDEEMEDDKKDDKEKLSKRKLKKLTRLSVAELKQLVQRPDVVEMHDVTAEDPKLLVQLKAHRNTVQVPRHWCFKRKYLQGKRGIEKPPFDLPQFIKKTGIMEMRASLQEKDESKTLKAKMRERARPKMGKIDIDYQKLHDAFFKWQTKPRMTIHGDLYYEGKEFETRLKEKKPGDLSEELRTALGMPIGPNCHKIPPPWLIAQQRYGPPPSYPNLKIPGLNAPIPDGTSFGYHAGGWGKPPVDEKGKPLYGDVFGTNLIDPDSGVDEGDIDRNVWGELESESEESSEEEEEEGEDLTNAPDESGLVTPAEGLVTPSGLTSGVPPGLETPDTIELRKKKIENEMEDNETPVLYQILPEKRTDRVGTSMMASTHVYDMSTATGKPPPNLTHRSQPSVTDREGMVELALDPSELDMDNDAMAQRYEQQMREQQSHLQKEDLSDMLAEHVARQKSKRKRQQGSSTDTTSKQTKKYKEFKF